MGKSMAIHTTKPAAREKVTRAEILSYGLGGAAATMPLIFKNSFMMFFLTDIVYLDPLRVGFWITAMVVFDAVNDPFIGGLADRTNTKRWGKYRPHMMISTVLWAVVCVLIFLTPDLAGRAQMGYYVLMMMLFSVFCTQFTVPWQAMNSVISTDPHQRNLLLTSRQLIGFFSGAVSTIMAVPIIRQFRQPAHGYLAGAAVTAVVLLVTGLLCAHGLRHRDYYGSIPTPPRVRFKDQLGIILKNRAVLCSALLMGVAALVNSMNGALQLYYLNYVVGDDMVLTWISVIGLVSSMIVIPLVPALLKRFTKASCLLFGIVLAACSNLPLVFLREHATVTQIILMSFVFALGFAMCNMAAIALVPDVTDYTELHYGNSQAGLINSTVTFTTKMCGSLPSLAVGAMLALVGYNAANPEASANNPAMRDMILNIKILYPLVLLVLAVILVKAYPITRQYGIEMRERLKESRKNA